MIRDYLFHFILVVGFFPVFSQVDLIQNVYNRNSTSLNGSWHYIVDPYENGYYNYRLMPFDQQESPNAGAFFLNSKPKSPSDLIEYNFDIMDTIQVPGDWNSQKPELLYYEGTVWYKKSFDYTFTKSQGRLFLYFEASNYKTEVYLNGTKLGTHIGGFTPFNFEITDLVKEKDNFLIVKVDNKRLKEGVPTLNTDWWNYGGITRNVKILEMPEIFIQDYFIQLHPEDTQLLKGHVLLNGEDLDRKKIRISIPGLNVDQVMKTNTAGYVTFEIQAFDIQYWSTAKPFLYDIVLATETIKSGIRLALEL